MLAARMHFAFLPVIWILWLGTIYWRVFPRTLPPGLAAVSWLYSPTCVLCQGRLLRVFLCWGVHVNQSLRSMSPETAGIIVVGVWQNFQEAWYKQLQCTHSDSLESHSPNFINFKPHRSLTICKDEVSSVMLKGSERTINELMNQCSASRFSLQVFGDEKFSVSNVTFSPSLLQLFLANHY